MGPETYVVCADVIASNGRNGLVRVIESTIEKGVPNPS